MRGIVGRLIATALPPLALAGPGAGQQPWSLASPAYEASQDVGAESDFAFVTDSIVELARLPHLRAVTLPDDLVELRFWFGFGKTVPHSLVRLVADSNGVIGELFWWWEGVPSSADDNIWADFHRTVREAAVENGCRESRDRVSGICLIDLGTDEPDWRSLFSELRSLGALDLPHEDSLPPSGIMTLDGISLSVEVLRGRRFHTYTYGNPQNQPWPEARTASTILEILLALRPDVW